MRTQTRFGEQREREIEQGGIAVRVQERQIDLSAALC